MTTSLWSESFNWMMEMRSFPSFGSNQKPLLFISFSCGRFHKSTNLIDPQIQITFYFLSNHDCFHCLIIQFDIFPTLLLLSTPLWYWWKLNGDQSIQEKVSTWMWLVPMVCWLVCWLKSCTGKWLRLLDFFYNEFFPGSDTKSSLQRKLILYQQFHRYSLHVSSIPIKSLFKLNEKINSFY